MSTSRIRGRGAAVLIVILAALSVAAPVAARAHRFLTLPFAVTRSIHVEDGWWRVDGTAHHGIDYIHGQVGKGWTWSGFPVIAAADGWACAALDDTEGCIIGVGTRVLIRHKLPDGTVFLTYYGHLRKVAPAIAVGTDRYSTFVKRGQLLGWAGRTGLPGTGIHLHFELMRKPGDWIDPYDLYARRGAYPDPAGRNALKSGDAYWWLDRVPAPPAPATAGFRTS
jgi:murein DD-endopeptidase MepM/ murein hydrolase activator NlpD